MTLTNLERAEHDRLLLENGLLVIEAAIAGHPTTPLNEVECDMYLEVMVQQRIELADVYKRIINTKPADLHPYNLSYADLSKRIYTARSFLQTLKNTLRPPPTSSSSPTTSSQPPSIRLPQLELPKFSGNYEDWQSFQDLFNNTVKKSSAISDAEKLSNLRSCVQGEASQLIKSFTITDRHFKEAWDLLDKRYNNKKEIVQSQVRRLVNQQTVKSESAAQLQQLLNTTNECLRSLRVLGRDIDHWDDLLIIIIGDKMDAETRAEWSKCHRGTDPPTYADLENFLQDHIRSLLARGNIVGKQPQQRAAISTSKQTSTHHTSQQPQQCIFCSEAHLIFYCDKFSNMAMSDRNTFVKTKGLCFNCLKRGHNTRECKSKYRCKKCHKPHNTLLHFEQSSSKTDDPKQKGSTDTTTVTTTTTAVAVPSSSSGFNTQVLLKTIKLIVTDSIGKEHVVRAALDECSQSSYITESYATALGLPRKAENVVVNGISGATITRLKHSVNFLARSRINKEVVPVHALVMGRITRDLQKVTCNSNNWNHINDLELADPEFSEPGRIDILLGAEVGAIILREGIRIGIPGISPTAQKTMFGWVLFGSVQLAPTFEVTTNVSTCEVDRTLRKFWEIEDIPKTKHLTQEETECEKHFIRTHSRDENGRYLCRLPFNSKKSSLGESKQQALLRFSQLEKRFKRQPAIKEEYFKFMREYLELNHMELVPDDELDSECVYYLPRHCVTREESTTTKLRVVFDGSAKTSTGIGLNDALLVGPVVQNDLFTILLRFRENLLP